MHIPCGLHPQTQQCESWGARSVWTCCVFMCMERTGWNVHKRRAHGQTLPCSPEADTNFRTRTHANKMQSKWQQHPTHANQHPNNMTTPHKHNTKSYRITSWQPIVFAFCLDFIGMLLGFCWHVVGILLSFYCHVIIILFSCMTSRFTSFKSVDMPICAHVCRYVPICAHPPKHPQAKK